MMVGYDHGQPQFICMIGLNLGSYPVVAGDDRIHSRLFGFINKLYIDAVTVFYPVRDRIVTVCPQIRKAFVENKSGAYTVHIIITYYTYLLSLSYLFKHNFNEHVHCIQQKRIVPIIGRFFNKRTHQRNVGKSSVSHDACANRRDAKLLAHFYVISAFSDLNPLFVHLYFKAKCRINPAL